MSKEIAFNEYADKAVQILSKGAFLTTAVDGKVNTMTIGWGSIGFMWGKPVFMAMVRPSRYTYELLEQSGEFTVSIPLTDMQAALGVCGSKSGRDMDKLAAAALTAKSAKKLATPVIAGGGITYECKVVYKQTMTAVPEELKQKWYGNGDYHTLYFGEILASYIEE